MIALARAGRGAYRCSAGHDSRVRGIFGHIFGRVAKQRSARDLVMGTKLFVGNLSYSITEQEIREAFGQNGRTVQSVRIALDRETQRPRGFAFVEMKDDPEADQAIA